MRHLSTLALAGLFGGLLLVGDASACHKKKAAACACPAPAPVVCAPAPAPVVVCEAPKKAKHMKLKMPKLAHHKKAAVCETYAAPTYYPTPQAYPSAQASGQGM